MCDLVEAYGHLPDIYRAPSPEMYRAPSPVINRSPSPVRQPSPRPDRPYYDPQYVYDYDRYDRDYDGRDYDGRDYDSVDRHRDPYRRRRPVLSHNFIRRSLLGKSYAYAVTFLRRYGVRHRIVAVDDFSPIVTQDYDRNRVNLSLRTPYRFRSNTRFDVIRFVQGSPQVATVTRAEFY